LDISRIKSPSNEDMRRLGRYAEAQSILEKSGV
jgi:hypothetical protein